ncbi:MAG: type I-E CRISPR-associated protein Cas5/CasD [Proteobacteria bacterium]|nr:type I-E CRISPR-associated protein Cas5/CasD [Pseudomonadota bacterium]MBU4472093.1 type I-E CRISPR-associated protein Cas5/CasD [Pseudomonadota bacterium]MCG2752908.1 type I-E CRISPR-associated protein Cas5/CasD [Desulfobacteraceae bacterium]
MLNKYLALRLFGVLQSWGYNSEYTYRNSGLFPTKSAVLGLCCAAKGLNRGSQEERTFLESVSNCTMTAIALPRKRTARGEPRPINVRRIEDFHTVENTKTASGNPNPNAVITYRQYLCDADFLVLVEVSQEIAEDLKNKLSDPDWGLWLGRKSCIPSAPVFAGVYASLDEVCSRLLDGKTLNRYTYQKDAASFEMGTDTLMDKPVDYAIDKRKLGQRRVKIWEADT